MKQRGRTILSAFALAATLALPKLALAVNAGYAGHYYGTVPDGTRWAAEVSATGTMTLTTFTGFQFSGPVSPSTGSFTLTSTRADTNATLTGSIDRPSGALTADIDGYHLTGGTSAALVQRCKAHVIDPSYTPGQVLVTENWSMGNSSTYLMNFGNPIDRADTMGIKVSDIVQECGGVFPSASAQGYTEGATAKNNYHESVYAAHASGGLLTISATSDATRPPDGTWQGVIVTSFVDHAPLAVTYSIKTGEFSYSVGGGQRVAFTDAKGQNPLISTSVRSGNFSGTLPQLVLLPGQAIGPFVYTDNPNFGLGFGPVTVKATGGDSGNAVTFGSLTPDVCTIAGNTLTLLDGGTCTITADQAGNSEYNPAMQLVESIAVGKPNGGGGGGGGGLALTQGWNLLGNSWNQPIDVASAFGSSAAVTSVWKWDNAGSRWLFYAPALSAAALQEKASASGLGVLNSILPGEGYWVNAKAPGAFGALGTTGFGLSAANLGAGWNLVATGNDVSAAAFNRSLADTPPSPAVVPLNLTSLWAWDSAQSSWYFYAPSLDASGGLGAYLSDKGYSDFALHGKTLGNGVGFWVNRP